MKIKKVRNQQLYIDIGNNIKKFRLARGMTQDKLASLCERERTSFNQLEKGITRVHLDLLYDIANFLNISIKDLLPNSDFSNTPPDLISQEIKKTKTFIRYWDEDLSKITGYEKLTEISEHNIIKVATEIFQKGLNVMICHESDFNIIWINNSEFLKK